MGSRTYEHHHPHPHPLLPSMMDVLPSEVGSVVKEKRRVGGTLRRGPRVLLQICAPFADSPFWRGPQWVPGESSVTRRTKGG